MGVAPSAVCVAIVGVRLILVLSAVLILKAVSSLGEELLVSLIVVYK